MWKTLLSSLGSPGCTFRHLPKVPKVPPPLPLFFCGKEEAPAELMHVHSRHTEHILYRGRRVKPPDLMVLVCKNSWRFYIWGLYLHWHPLSSVSSKNGFQQGEKVRAEVVFFEINFVSDLQYFTFDWNPTQWEINGIFFHAASFQVSNLTQHLESHQLIIPWQFNTRPAAPPKPKIWVRALLRQGKEQICTF